MRKTAIVLAVMLLAGTAQAVTYELVPVGNAGNADFDNGPVVRGGVAYDYLIGKFGVTQGQYTEFLNAKAASDPYGLWTTSRGLAEDIARAGSDGSYTYSTPSPDKCVNYVDMGDAMRFANWMHNGQGTADTETGAYTMSGLDAQSGPDQPAIVALLDAGPNPGASYWVPTVDEWHKAAFYDPTLNSGAGGYWDFATMTNTLGDIDNTVPDVTGHNVNMNIGGYTVGAGGDYTTDVDLFGSSSGYYGAFDMHGNVGEWTATSINTTSVIIMGSAFHQTPSTATLGVAGSYGGLQINQQTFAYGFRLASNVPEPATMSLLALGGLAVLRRRRK